MLTCVFYFQPLLITSLKFKIYKIHNLAATPVLGKSTIERENFLQSML